MKSTAVWVILVSCILIPVNSVYGANCMALFTKPNGERRDRTPFDDAYTLDELRTLVSTGILRREFLPPESAVQILKDYPKILDVGSVATAIIHLALLCTRERFVIDVLNETNPWTRFDDISLWLKRLESESVVELGNGFLRFGVVVIEHIVPTKMPPGTSTPSPKPQWDRGVAELAELLAVSLPGEPYFRPVSVAGVELSKLPYSRELYEQLGEHYVERSRSPKAAAILGLELVATYLGDLEYRMNRAPRPIRHHFGDLNRSLRLLIQEGSRKDLIIDFQSGPVSLERYSFYYDLLDPINPKSKAIVVMRGADEAELRRLVRRYPRIFALTIDESWQILTITRDSQMESLLITIEQ